MGNGPHVRVVPGAGPAYKRRDGPGQRVAGGRDFDSRVHAYNAAFECGFQAAPCLDVWQLAGGPTFSHVYIAKSPAQCCTTLLGSLRTTATYEEIYDGPGATIFARRLIDTGEPAALKVTPMWHVPDWR